MEALANFLVSGGWEAYAVVIGIGVPLYLLAAWGLERWLGDSDWLVALQLKRD